MRALDLDLVRRRPAWPSWLMLLLGLALTGQVVLDTLNLRAEERLLQARRAGRAPAAVQPTPPVNEPLRRELDAAQQVLSELALPWEALFQAIETAIDGHTALLAIEPDAGRHAVRITGEARNYLAILSLMARLEATQPLARVHLLNHQIRDDVAQRPYQFTLSATWRTLP
jgi:Tfp pilus assembly protein PilN